MSPEPLKGVLTEYEDTEPATVGLRDDLGGTRTKWKRADKPRSSVSLEGLPPRREGRSRVQPPYPGSQTGPRWGTYLTGRNKRTFRSFPTSCLAPRLPSGFTSTSPTVSPPRGLPVRPSSPGRGCRHPYGTLPWVDGKKGVQDPLDLGRKETDRRIPRFRLLKDLVNLWVLRKRGVVFTKVLNEGRL